MTCAQGLKFESHPISVSEGATCYDVTLRSTRRSRLEVHNKGWFHSANPKIPEKQTSWEEHRMNHSTSDKNKTTNKIRIHLHSSLAASSLNVAEGPNMSYGIQVLLSREQEHVMSSSLAVRKLPIRTSTPQYK